MMLRSRTELLCTRDWLRGCEESGQHLASHRESSLELRTQRRKLTARKRLRHSPFSRTDPFTLLSSLCTLRVSEGSKSCERHGDLWSRDSEHSCAVYDKPSPCVCRICQFRRRRSGVRQLFTHCGRIPLLHSPHGRAPPRRRLLA